MAAPINAIYTGKVAFGTATILPATTANVKSDGAGTIGTDMLKAFTADATNGSFVEKVRFSPVALAAATATTATTLRVFISSKTSSTTTNTDTWLFAEVSAAAQTAAHSTNATFFIEVPMNVRLLPSYTILVSTHIVAATSTGWQALVFAGDYNT